MDVEFFDSLHEGDSANGVKLCMGLTDGDFWARVGGCQMLYRGLSMEEIDFGDILAVAERDAGAMSPPSYVPHDCGTTYFYVIRRANDCGYQERTLSAAVKVKIDADGELAEPEPNKILLMKAEQVAGNKAELSWYYCPLAQHSAPVCFKVYCDGGTGQVDYGNPVGTVGYEGRRFYHYRSDVLVPGEYLFAVRAEDADGVQDASLAAVEVQVHSTLSGAVTILSAEAV
jgi:hypothetical protein